MRAWELAGTLDPLPQRLGLDLDGLEEGVVSDLVGAVWCLDHGARLQGLAVAKGQWRAWGERLCAGVGRSHSLAHTVGVLCDELGVDRGAATARFAAWQQVRLALAGVRAAIGWPGQAQSDAWLRWVHGRSRSGRAHHYGQLILALTAKPACLWSANALAQRLFARVAEPFDFDALLRAQLGREDLRPAGEVQRHDVRGLPMARFLAAWLWLECEACDQTADVWLTKAASALQKAGEGAWRGELPVQRALWERSDGALVPTEGEGRKRWVSAVIVERKAVDTGPPASTVGLPAGPRVSAALAFALNQTADNFATRVMPSLAMWPVFWQQVHGWMEAHPELVASRGAHEPWLWPWHIHDGSAVAWSASRLFLQVCRRLLDGDRSIELRSVELRHQEGRRALIEVVDDLIEQLGSSAVARRARSRELGLRWTSMTLSPTMETWVPTAP